MHILFHLYPAKAYICTFIDNLIMGAQTSEKDNQEEDHLNTVQSQFIYMSDITRISRVNERIVIEQKNSESECLVFANAEKSKVV